MNNHRTLRQAFATFESADGNVVMFMAMGEPGSWDDAVIEDFLNSIK